VLAIVMSGGAGTRLWPLSRRRTPKQLITLLGEASLLQQTVSRLERFLPAEAIYVVTSSALVRATRSQLPQLPEENVIGEPLARSTAVAAGLVMTVARHDADEVWAAIPADHYIREAAAFGAALAEAERTARRGYLVCLGVRPTHEATGYGYIKAADPLAAGSEALRVERFVEKPDPATAAGFVEEGGYLWNAGIFVWREYIFRKALADYQPQMAAALDRIAGLRRLPGWESDVRAVLQDLPAIPIDYAIAEPAAAAGQMAVVPLAAGWSDIGSWSAVLEAAGAETVIAMGGMGEHLDRGSRNVLVHGGGDRLVVTVGLQDVIIVDTPDALLVCAPDRAEEIKSVLDEIATRSGEKYL
jgi:mannose-1-phosphate guanylyltransferase